MKLKIVLKGCTNLKNSDFFDKSDPYCKVSVVGDPCTTFETVVRWNDLNPTWNHETEVDWDGSGAIFFQVMDKDHFTEDDLLGLAVVEGKSVGCGFSGELPLEEPIFADGDGPCLAVHARLFQGMQGAWSVDGRGVHKVNTGARLNVELVPERGPPGCAVGCEVM